MHTPNPYQVPAAQLQDIAEAEGELQLASRSRRFWAVTIDAVIGFATALPLMVFFGLWRHMLQGHRPPMHMMVSYVTASVLVYLLIHGWLLHRHAQTVGKKLLGIKIVDMDGHKASVGRIMLLRFLPVTLGSMLPVAGGLISLIDILLIFRQDRRCAHDLLAGTQVVNA